MNPEIIIPSQTQTNIMKCLSYMESNFLYDTNELIYKTKKDTQISKTNLWLPMRNCGREN